MAVLETVAVILIWTNVILGIFIGIPLVWYWAATGYEEGPWTPGRAAVRTSLSLIFSAALLILLLR